MDLAVRAADQVPVLIAFDSAQELVGDAHRVVRVLAGDREIGFRIPVGVIGVELDVRVALTRELDDALDVIVRHEVAARELDRLLQRRVLLRVEAIVARAFAIHAGLEDGLHVLLDDLGAGDEGGDLLLLLHLPVDVVLDVRMVGVDHDHLRRAARRAARLDGARRAVADLEEAHQARRLAAARQLLVLAAQAREVGARARAVLEQARLTHPQVHDAALVDEIVGDGLDEAGVRLGMLVSRLRLGELAGERVDIEMALARAVDAIGPVQAGVEPLRRVRRGDLSGQHVAHLVVEGLRVLLAVEVLALPAPIGPRAGEAVEHLRGGHLAAVALLFRQFGQRFLVGDRAPQEGGDVVLFNLLQAGGDAGLAEILLRDDVASHLAPRRRHVDAVEREDDRAVGISDFALGLAEFDPRVRRLSCCRIAPLDPHLISPFDADDKSA